MVVLVVGVVVVEVFVVPSSKPVSIHDLNRTIFEELILLEFFGIDPELIAL